MALWQYVPGATTKGLYRLDTGYTDSSASGWDGTAANMSLVGWRNGAGSGSFNGTNGRVDLWVRDWGIAAALTLRAWIKVTDYLDFRGILNKDDGTVAPVHRHFFFRINQTTGTLNFIRFNSSNAVVTNLNSPGAVWTDWALVHATFSNSVGSKIFINGKQVASDAVTTNNATAADENTYIGARDSWSLQNFFKGLIDEVAIEAKELSTSQVVRDYTYSKGYFATL